MALLLNRPATLHANDRNRRTTENTPHPPSYLWNPFPRVEGYELFVVCLAVARPRQGIRYSRFQMAK
jgi:hypothetical protein